MKARIVGLGVGVLLIVTAFGLVLWQAGNLPATNTAFAQGGTTATPTAEPTTAATPEPGATTTPALPQQTSSAIGDTFWTLLADKLGVDADELKQQAVETRREMVDQAVTDGRTTQEEADVLKERITSNNIIAPITLGRTQRPGNMPNQPNSQQQPRRGPFGWFGNGGGFPGMGGFGRLFGHGGLGANLDVVTAVAESLNMEPKALIEQMSQGQSLADIAQAQGVDEAAVKEAIISYYTEKIDEQLALGLISEVQANQLKSQLTPDSIDLSRGLQFRFRLMPGDQDSSQLFPGMGFGQGFSLEPGDMEQFGQMFGLTPEQMQEFGEMFGLDSEGGLNIPLGDIQTQ
jgi:uncharacterized protein YidB (DUF937 family)